MSRLDSVSARHIFVMVHKQHLQREGQQLSLNFMPGDILIFKSTYFDLTPERGHDDQSHLDLYNKNDDIILHITFWVGQKKIFCNDCRSDFIVGNGWGKERSANLGPILEKMKLQSVAISLCTFWTESRITWYQILFNLITVCYFNSHFPGPATQMRYSQDGQTKVQLLDTLEVACFKFSNLPLEEWQAIESR